MVRTDLDEETALQAATTLESIRNALISAAWPLDNFSDEKRTTVIVISDEREFRRVWGSFNGIFASRPEPTLFVLGPREQWKLRPMRGANSHLVHEVAHQLTRSRIKEAPAWFLEGVAEYLETAYVSEDERLVFVGAVNHDAFHLYQANPNISLLRMLHWKGSSDGLYEGEPPALYGHAWVFVHWLYDENRERFARYRAELRGGTDPDRAFAIAFPQFDVESVRAQLNYYVRDRRFAVWSRPLRTAQPTLSHKALTNADAHVVYARMALSGAQGRSGPERDALLAEARDEVERALALDRTNVEALSLQTWAPADVRLASARRAVAAHPDDPMAFVLLETLSGSAAAGKGAEAPALASLPSDAGTLTELAWVFLREHRASQALPLAERALKQEPNSVDVNDAYAEAMFQLGRCEPSRAHAQRALDLARDRRASDRERLAKRLSEIRAVCGTGDAEK